MSETIAQRVKRLNWQQWLLLAAFLFVVGFTGLHAFRFVRSTVYWHNHRDEPIRGWMTIGYVAHSYHVPPYILYEALGLPNKPHDRRPLREIAKAQNRSIEEIKVVLQDAIVHARPPYPPPSPPPPDKGRSP